MKKLTSLKVSEFAQGSFDWRKARLGKFTATRIADIMSKGRGKDELFGDSAISMMAEVAAERNLVDELLQDEDRFQEWSDYQCRTNAAMEFGHNYEPIARARYTIETGYDVVETGLIDSTDINSLAVSPDGLILTKGGFVEGMVEIKCPSTCKTFQRYKWFIKDAESLKKEKKEYYWQVMANLLITDAKWCDFVVFSPFQQDGLHIVRVERNEDDIELIKKRVEEAEEFIAQIKS